MFIVIESREDIANGFVSCFDREGVAAVAMSETDFNDWFQLSSKAELMSVEAVLVGDCPERCNLARTIRSRSVIPIIAITESKLLVDTLDLFSAGCDDVVCKPVHVRELLVRAGVASRGLKGHQDLSFSDGIQVFLDGRDPIVSGECLPLPRRERRILEYFVINKGRRVSKTQIYNFVYGMFSYEIEECVIESHISKLRKKLRYRLGFDPIDSQRYLGYRLIDSINGLVDREADFAVSPGVASNFAQDELAVLCAGSALEDIGK